MRRAVLVRALYVLVVLVLGFFNFLVGIPVGYAFELSTPTIYIASMIGCVGGTIALVAWAEHLMPPVRRAWRGLVARVLPGRGERDADAAVRSRRREWIDALTERHGAIALGLVGPFVIGGLATAVIGVALGLRRTQLALGLAISLSGMVTAYMIIVHAALR